MSRYEQLFQHLQSRNQGAFIPFVTLGDPSAEVSLQIIDALVAGGADALEIGIPFSDPLADGPVIQDANLRAFAAGMTPARCFELIAQIRAKYPELPVGLLMYANLVFHNGISQFYETAAKARVDSVLIADVPLHESQPFRTLRWPVISHRSLSVRRMRMINYWKHWPPPEKAIPTCSPVPG